MILQAMRDHLHAYGRVLGFLTIHARLSEGAKEPTVPSLSTSPATLAAVSRWRLPRHSEHYQLLSTEWKEGVVQAEQVYAQMDLELIEDSGPAAGFTHYSSPSPMRSTARLWISWVVGAVLAVFATERLPEGLTRLTHRLGFSATAFRPTPSVGARPAVAGDATG